MKRLLAAVLMLTVFAGPAFAAQKPHKQHHKADYRYHTPKYKYKAPKSHNHHSHPPSAGTSQSK